MPYARVRVEDSSREASADDEGLFAICVPLGLAEFVATADGYDEGRQAYDVRGNTTMIRLVVASLALEFRKHVSHEFSLRFAAGSSTVDTVLQDRRVYIGNCSPCSFSLDSPAFPDFVLLEAEWRRVPNPPPEFDTVHHVLKAGTPYDEGEEFSARTEPRPHRFLFNRSAYENASAFQRGGNYGFSGALHCSLGCADTVIDVHFTLFFNYSVAPEEFSAVRNPESALAERPQTAPSHPFAAVVAGSTLQNLH